MKWANNPIIKYVWLVIALLVFGAAGFIGLSLDRDQKNNPANSQPVNTNTAAASNNHPATTGFTKSLGFSLDDYDAATDRAGDMLFTKVELPYDRIFWDYGFIIPAEDTADKVAVVNPHPSFILPLGTKVLAPIDGVVTSVPELYSGDSSVQMTPDGKMTGLIYEIEHIKDPLVKVGDRVTAGQVIAEVTDFSSHNHPGFGYFDLAVFHTKSDGQPEHLCPFRYLDPAVESELRGKIMKLYQDWEDYFGDSSIYNEAAYSVPGCLTIEPIPG